MIREIEVYPTPVKEHETVYSPNPNSSGCGAIDVCKMAIDNTIQKELERLGCYKDGEGNHIDYTNTRKLPDDVRDRLNKSLRNHNGITSLSMLIFSMNAPQLLEIYTGNEKYLLPELADWNSADKTKMDSTVYSNGTLTVNGLNQLHSYVVQATRKPDVPKGIVDSPSVSSIVFSKDGYFPLGYRGGRNLPNTLMTVPAGSVFIPESNNVDYIFESFRKELFDELGQTKDDIETATINGKVFDNAVGGNSLFVVIAQSKLNKREMIQRWEEKSKDRYEHKGLTWLDTMYPDKIRTFLEKHDLPYNRTNTPDVGIENAPLLKPAKLTLMAYLQSLTDDFEYRIKHNM